MIGDPDLAAVYDAVADVETEVGRPINATVRSPTEWDNADGAVERAVRGEPKLELT